MGGVDPYSSSKAAAEIVVEAYRRSFFTGGAAIASARGGNVIGGGDWSIDRIVPDIIRAAVRGVAPELRNPASVRPWQHVLDALAGYILLSEKAAEQPQTFAESWNFGPDLANASTVEDLAARLLLALGRPATLEIKQRENDVHEARLLHVDSSKARALLGWRPRLSGDQAIAWTADWYRAWNEGAPMNEPTSEQIREYFGV